MFDLIIKNGLIYDGNGTEPYEADIAINRGVISKIGSIDESAKQVIDAQGKAVTPGFVDIHTHYDGQVTWTNRLDPSSHHGVTTAVMGNCGVGFAPCKPEDRSKLVELMEGVEDIPEVVMAEGIPWAWESFEQYLDFLDNRSYDMDIAAMLPHAPLRVFVMGDRALALEEANEDDIVQMRAIARRAIEAGAIGFGTSRSINHRSSSGAPVFTRDAAEKELVGIATAIGETGSGVLQGIADLTSSENAVERVGLWRRMAEASGRPMSFTLAQFNNSSAWKAALEQVEKANAEGVTLRGQVFPRPVGVVYGLELSRTPLSGSATYEALKPLPLDEKVGRMREPEVRRQILAEAAADKSSNRWYHLIFPVEAVPNYEPAPGTDLKSLSEKTGKSADEIAYDMLLENNGHGMLWGAYGNYYEGDLSNVHTMITHDNTLIGLGDGGAHYGMICDASYPTQMLCYWGRDRRSGPTIPLAQIIKSLTRDNALAVGLNDRGAIAPGLKADFNIIDLDNLQLHPPVVTRDLPAGGSRMAQLSSGYIATIVNGEVTYQNGEATGALPGRLVRGNQIKAAAAA